ncbi:MAG TPA: hypothetical protein PKC40_07370, partial [Saprospiraceae bacterium]|nr:hypothetical protein [Saprospiraceae bacterium]
MAAAGFRVVPGNFFYHPIIFTPFLQKTLIMKLIIRTLLSALLLATIFSACKSEPAKKQKDFDAIAKELCECMQPLAEWNAKVKEISATQD